MPLHQRQGAATLHRANKDRAGLPTQGHVLYLSIALNALLSLLVVYSALTTTRGDGGGASVRSKSESGRGGAATFLHGDEIVWHGGHPAATERTGSCWCNDAEYCMCTPSLAIDVVITSGPDRDRVWLVRRGDTGQLATMGGFVQVGETAESAVARELKEEMGIDLKASGTPPVLFGIYSDPRRDGRRHTVSAVYVVHLDGTERPVAADDAKGVERIPIDDVERYEYFADHRTILLDYRRRSRTGRVQTKLEITKDEDGSGGDFAPDITRSIC